jgi:hypothetical protein
MASEPYKIKVERMHFWSPDLSAHSGPKYQAIAAAL